MDISIKCQVSLSKKLRALLQEGETRITLVASNITDGRGDATLNISSDKKINTNTQDFINKETSIMIVPTSIEEMQMNNTTVSSIFNKNAKIVKPTQNAQNAQKRIAVDKIAAIEPPEEYGDEANSIKTEDEIEEEIPKQFEETKNPQFKRYINSLSELAAEIKIAKNKSCDIDIDSYQDVRKRAEAIELKEKAEAIDVDAFIVNDKCANLSVNDLGINLALNAPYNLANISAKRLLGSKDLISLFNSKLVKFIKPEEIPIYIDKAVHAVENHTLDVFSSPEEAEESMERSGMNVEKIEISMDEFGTGSRRVGQNSYRNEDETVLTNLTQRPTRSGLTVKSTHGNMSGSNRPNRTTTQEAQDNGKGIKTIRRSF